MAGIRDSVENYEEWREGFTQALFETENYYLHEDVDNRAKGIFAHAARVAIKFSPFDTTVHEMFAGQRERRGRDIEPKHAFNLLLRGFQADQLTHNPDNYPIEDEMQWIEVFGDIERDDLRWAILINNVSHKDVQSNIAERYKTVQLLAHLMKDRLGDSPSHLDVGSSVLQGDVKLAYNNLPNLGVGIFKDIQLLKRSNEGEPLIDERISFLANLAIKQHVSYSDIVGIDITSVDDQVIQQWAKSCSFYPDELKDPQKIAEYDLLHQLDPRHERVKFYRADFSELDIAEFKTWAPREKFDIITFSTVLYQLSEQEKEQSLENARNLLSDKGIILIQDDPTGNFEGLYQYESSLLDGPDANVKQKILTWENGRCSRAILETGEIAFNGYTKQTLEEALLEQNTD